MNYFWLYLNPDTFLWKDEKSVLIYNSLNGYGFTFPIIGIEKLIENIHLPTNMYCITLDQTQIDNPDVKYFIDLLIKYSAGNIIEYNAQKTKPVIFYPIVNIKHNYNIYHDESKFRHDDDISNCLSEVSIDLCGVKSNEKYKKHLQFTYPSDINKSLPCDLALKFLLKLQSWPVTKINLIGLNPINFHLYTPILDYLKENQLKATVFIRLRDLNIERSKFLANILDDFHIILIIEQLTGLEFHFALFESIICQFQKINYEFIVASQREFFGVIKVLNSLKPINYSIKPYYNGFNSRFFKKYVYNEPNELLSRKLNKRQIFAHQTINTYDYGHIRLLPDGLIYANLNFPAIGHVNENLKDLIFNEHVNGNSWMRTRCHFPCKGCLFQWLCPSPSNYELVIGKPNLCTIEKNSLIDI